MKITQSKEVFSVEEAKDFVQEQTLAALDNWASMNPNDLQKLCKYFKEVCEIRMKSEGEKIKMSNKYATSALPGGLPSKYKKPNGKKNIEVWITEGDSAASSLENNRDKQTQGIMTIRVKYFAHYYSNIVVKSLWIAGKY